MASEVNSGSDSASSGSSSEEGNEDLARLREAVNHEFIDQSLFNGEKKLKTGNGDETTKKKLVSLKRLPEDEQFQNEVHVTPGFQKFVSKKLGKIIDSQIEEFTKTKEIKPKLEPEGGIKLFSTSKAFVSLEAEVIPEIRTKRRKQTSSESSESERERMSHVAVSSEWVLNKEGIKGWEPSRRGDEVIVNRKGEIVEKKKSRYSKT